MLKRNVSFFSANMKPCSSSGAASVHADHFSLSCKCLVEVSGTLVSLSYTDIPLQTRVCADQATWWRLRSLFSRTASSVLSVWWNPWVPICEAQELTAFWHLCQTREGQVLCSALDILWDRRLVKFGTLQPTSRCWEDIVSDRMT
jgi:hypothetical protein